MVQQRKRYGPETVLDQVETRNLVWNPVTLAYEPAQVQTEELIDPTLGYKISDIDEGSTSYYGYLDKSGNWYIMQVTATTVRYIKGTEDYSTNWEGRAELMYDYFSGVF
jgi:hypothetical protein